MKKHFLTIIAFTLMVSGNSHAQFFDTAEELTYYTSEGPEIVFPMEDQQPRKRHLCQFRQRCGIRWRLS
jgi:hypothetical protein